MTIETMLKIRQMLVDFGAPMQYWDDEQLNALQALDEAIVERRTIQGDGGSFL